MADIIKQIQVGGTTYDIQTTPIFYDATVSNNAFSVTVPYVTALADGIAIHVKMPAATATGATLNVNGLGAKEIYYREATAVTSHIAKDNYVTFIYEASTQHWVMQFSYYSDSNSVGYQVRTNKALWANKTGYTMNRYTLLFEVDGGLSGAARTISTTTSKVTVPFKYIPGGVIKYYSSSGNIANNANFTATGLWDQYEVNLSYTFNTGSTLTSGKPVYMRCSINTDGTLTPNYKGSPSHPITQTLPTTEDGYVYVFLGQAYNTTNMELYNNHPIYQYKDGKLQVYTGAPDVPTKTSDLTNDSGFVTSSSLATVATSGSYNDLVDTPDIPAKSLYIMQPGDVTITGEEVFDMGYPITLSSAIENVITIGQQSIFASGEIMSQFTGGAITTNTLFNNIDCDKISGSEIYSFQNIIRDAVSSPTALRAMCIYFIRSNSSWYLSLDSKVLNYLTEINHDDVINALGYTPGTGTVTSVGSGTGLSISGTASINPTVNIANGYKLPTTTEWNGKQNALPTTTTANKLLVSTTTSGNTKWSDFSSAGFLKTNTSGVVSVDTNSYLTTSGKAADSSKLNGQSASYYAAASDIPTKTSDLTNDSGFITTEHNQTVKSGSTTFGADAAVNIVAGSNVTVTPDATNNKITIAATDTTYSSKTAVSGGTDVSLVTTGEKYTWNSKQNALPTTTTAGKVLKSTSTAGTVQWADDTNTNQTIKGAGTAFGANDAIDIVAGSNVTVTPDTTNKKITIAATDTTYSSKSAASGGTDVSLVTTGEKYTWNNKAASNHAHGNITNTGTITSTAVTSATGVLVYDSNNKIQRATAANARSIIGAGTGTVTSVSAGTGLSISGTTTVTPKVNIASGYKLPTTAQWNSVLTTDDLRLGSNSDDPTYDSIVLGRDAEADSWDENEEAYGWANVVIGLNAKATNSEGSSINHSIAIGRDSYVSHSNAIAIGYESHATGSQGIAIGELANANYQSSIAIGYNTNGPADASYTRIGCGSYTSTGRALLLGNGMSAYTYMNSAGSSWSSASDIRDKTDIKEIDSALDFINSLKPITYVMNNREDYLYKDKEGKPLLNSEGKQYYDEESHRRGDKKHSRRFAGLSAQDTYQKMVEFYKDDNYADIVDINKYDNPNDEYLEQYSMQYERLVPFLIKAIQEQQEQIDELKKEIAELKK